MDGVQLPQGKNHFEEAVYFFTTKFQKFLVLILSTSEGWKAEPTLELHSCFEHGTPGLGPLWVAAVLWDNGNWINHWNSFEKTNFIPCAEELNSPIFP